MERKTACITGASRGIGRAIAEMFAADGYDLFLTCHKNEKMLQEFCSQLEEKYSVSCAAFAGDIGDADQTEQLFTMIEEKRGRLDVLVNNAGISWHGLLTDMTPDEWNTMINTNLSSVFYTSRLAIPLMLKRHRGKIINISSVWGCVGASCNTRTCTE